MRSTQPDAWIKNRLLLNVYKLSSLVRLLAVITYYKVSVRCAGGYITALHEGARGVQVEKCSPEINSEHWIEYEI